jgi:hypothetical protein
MTHGDERGKKEEEGKKNYHKCIITVTQNEKP